MLSLYYFYFDSGTTNTRAYLIHCHQIIRRVDIPVGSRDSALKHDRTILMLALKRLYHKILQEENLGDKDVQAIYMSGMVSSSSGMIEIEHLSLPMDFKTLKDSIAAYEDTEFFNRIIHIVPGLKTLPQGVTASLDTVALANNMRGEEIEIFGILHRCPELAAGHSIIVLPGSHTQTAFLCDGRIEDISSTITGELYHAIVSETILGSSLTGGIAEEIIPELVCMGYEIIHKYGFNRGLYVIRSMDLFAESTLAQRVSYMEGVLNGGVMDAIAQIMKDSSGTIAIAGPHMQYQIFSALVKKFFPQFQIMEVPVRQDCPFSVEGFLSLLYD